MTKHIILWQFKDKLSAEEKKTAAAGAKKALEALKGRIEGLTDIKVITEKLDTSNADMMLDSTFTSADALHNYSIHPLHVKAADEFVRPFTKSRTCIDYNYNDN